MQYKFGVYGASGRMGKSVVQLIGEEYSDQAVVVAAIDRKNWQLDELMQADAVIDFSLPDGTGLLLDWYESQTGDLPFYLCGTTGLSNSQHARFSRLAESTVVFQSNNFSMGVAALSAILKAATPMLKALGYTPEMTEVHHKHKIDSPSGTAKMLCEVIDPKVPESTQIHSVREGEVTGKHDVIFSGNDDRLIIGHEASDRCLFARGAIDAALWLCERSDTTGRYTMEIYFHKRFGASSNQVQV